MSTVNVKPSRSASDSVGYALYGNDKDKRTEHVQTGTDRAAAMSCSVESPWAFVARAEALARAHGRKNELYSYTQNFSPDEFGKNDRGHVQRVNELGVKLAERMHSADHLVVTHADSAGGHLHNHIYVINHDNLTGKSLQRNTSWKNGLRQANDELMQDEGCQVLPSPEQAKPDWSQRREDFASGRFERILGDKVAASLRDKRSVDRAGFTEVLDEHGVALAETQRDGWTYKMRRADNGKLGRKKASGLTPEFTAEGAQQIFEFHENNRPKGRAMSILDEMRNEQQETEPSSTASNLSEPTNADVIAAVNRQTKAVNGLKSHLRIAIEETVKEELKGLPSTLQPSVNKSPQIESTLGEFAQSLNGESLNAASQSLVAEAQRNHAATASVIEGLKAQAAANQNLVSQVGGAVQRIEKHIEERVQKAVEQVTGEASTTMTANLDASNERAERIIAATSKLEARQLWSAAAAMCLALLPVVVVVAGLWMGIAGLITGAQWALDVDGSVWLGIGRWLVVGAGLAGAGYGLFASVRWAAGLVETWKGRGMPTWPSWRKR